MFTPRSSGILLHPTSLPGPFGIGDLGPQAEAFVNWLAQAKQRWWQILPLNPTTDDGSPYMSPSAFAGNAALISPERLLEEGWVNQADVDAAKIPTPSGETHAEIAAAQRSKEVLLRRAFDRFYEHDHPASREFDRFCHEQADWLGPHTRFLALRGVNGGRDWREWTEYVDPKTKLPSVKSLADLVGAIAYYAFEQFLFDRQWRRIRDLARTQGVGLIGDLPIYVAADSADVWAGREFFKLDEKGYPTEVAGVPPDYFSATGQLWNNPIYDWDAIDASDYLWWKRRIRRTLDLVDVARIDHFRGFEAYWSVPAGEETAVGGQWNLGPGGKLFHAIARDLKRSAQELPLIAEDLGTITAEVTKLRKDFALPGMRVLHFELMSSQPTDWRVETYEKDTAVYSGTHDNDTSDGWFRSEITPNKELLDRVNWAAPPSGHGIGWDLTDLAWRSNADLAIAPVQDLLGLGSWARMNQPGTAWPARPNWRWRYRSGDLTPEAATSLAQLTIREKRNRS
ncbi:4-alpha-glucanotransferase [bacterium]|nr:4-alpha-glucanotransferase [bacterium]